MFSLLFLISAVLVTVAAQHQYDDVILTREQAERFSPGLEGQALNRQKWAHLLWPTDGRGIISYTISTRDFDQKWQAKIRSAVQYWQDHTCLSFQENGYRKPVIQFIRFLSSGCRSELGRRADSPQQHINLGWDCDDFGTMVHEIGHSLGLYHEQSRYDRDRYLKIHLENVPNHLKSQFDIVDSSNTTTFGLPYDYGSIMHYDEFSGAVNSNFPSMEAIPDAMYQMTMGQNIKPSFLDLLKMNMLYNCLGRCNTVCQNSGFPNPKNCNSCICPWGFGGDRCERRHYGSNNTATCGADLQASASWTTLRATLGVYSPLRRERHDECHWHIRAPQGRRVDIWIKEVGGKCSGMGGCPSFNVEFKMKRDFRLSGYRACCNSKLARKMISSESELAIISAYSQTAYDFEIAYRYN